MFSQMTERPLLTEPFWDRFKDRFELNAKEEKSSKQAHKDSKTIPHNLPYSLHCPADIDARFQCSTLTVTIFTLRRPLLRVIRHAAPSELRRFMT